MNPYYNHSGVPQQSGPGSSAAIRTELASIMAGFDKLPVLAGNQQKLVRVNGSGTALEAYEFQMGTMATQQANNVGITGGSISGVSLTLASPSTFRTHIGLVIGETVQAYSSLLTKFAALTGPADRLLYYSGNDTPALASLTAYGRTIVASADAATARASLELVKGTAAGNVVVLGSDGKLPAVDGSKLTGITSAIVQVAAGTVLVAATHQGKVVETISTNALTHTLPAGSTMIDGGEITFISQTIGNTVQANGGDLIRMGGDTLAQAALNPGTVLRFKWTGAEWRLEINPSRGFLHNYTGGDIALNRGESCHYDISGSTSLLLRIATQDKHMYEIDWGSSVTPSPSTQTWELRLNNSTYTGTVNVGVLYSSLNNQNAIGSVGTANSAMLLTPAGVGSHYSFRSIVHCRTALKQTFTQFRSLASTGYMGLVESASTDTTTLWTALGTLFFGTDTPQGRVTVRRVA